MVMEFIHGLIIVNSKEIGKRIKSLAMEYTPGKMEESMKATGNKITCMVRGTISGLTAESMKDNMLMIKRMATECIHIRTDGATKECGRMENSTVKVSS